MRYDPFRTNPLSWSRQIFEPMFNDEEEWPEFTLTQGLNVYEQDDKVIVKAAVPGISEDKLEITYEDGVLHIYGRAEETEEEKKKKKTVYKKQMISCVDYTTYLPRAVDAGKIEAEVNNGIVTIKAPVAQEAKPKKIPVKAVSRK